MCLLIAHQRWANTHPHATQSTYTHTHAKKANSCTAITLNHFFHAAGCQLQCRTTLLLTTHSTPTQSCDDSCLSVLTVAEVISTRNHPGCHFVYNRQASGNHRLIGTFNYVMSTVQKQKTKKRQKKKEKQENNTVKPGLIL